MRRGPEIFAAFATCALAFAARLRPMRNPDLFWQIRTGDVVLATKRRVAVDLFSAFFRGRPIHDHEAGFEALVAWLDRAGGMKLLWRVNLALVVVVCVAATFAARKLVTPMTPRIVGAAIVVAAIASRFELRAEAFTFGAIALAHLVRRNEPIARIGWRRFAPIVLAAIAAPFHSLAAIVAVTSVAHAIEAIVVRSREPKWMRSALVDVGVAGACVAAAELVAPGLLRTTAGSTVMAFKAHVVEYYSPWKVLERAHDATPIVALVLAAVAVVGLLRLVRATRARPADALLVALMIPPGLPWARFSMVPLLAALPWTIAGIAALVDLVSCRAGDVGRVGIAVVGVALGSVVVTEDLGKEEHVVGFALERQPVEAVEWLKVHRPSALLFHPYNFGAYLIYAEYPAKGVIIDARAQTVYPNDYAERYYAAVSDPVAFEAWVNEAGFDTVMLQRGHKSSAPLLAHLDEADDEWREAYADLVAIVFVKR